MAVDQWSIKQDLRESKIDDGDHRSASNHSLCADAIGISAGPHLVGPQRDVAVRDPSTQQPSWEGDVWNIQALQQQNSRSKWFTHPMHVQLVDPRSVSGEIYETATYEVRDWFNPDGDGPPTSESSHRISGASVWQVLEWADHLREPGQLASFIWVIYTENDGTRTRILIGVLEWTSDETTTPMFHASMSEPDSEEGWAYFTRNFPSYGS